MFAAIRRVFTRDPHAELRRVLGDIEVPAFPATTSAVLRGLRDSEVSMGQIGELVTRDPALSINVLKTVNTAAFGLRRPVSDASHAVRMLGRAALEGLVLGIAVREVLPCRTVEGFEPDTFWRTASQRAAVAQRLADLVEPAKARESFTAGLLQDLAVPMLAHVNPGGYRDKLVASQQGDGSLQQIEASHYGWDHSLVAGWLCEAWSFPEPLREAITGHHSPGQAHVSVVLAGMMPDTPGAEGDERMVEEARSVLGVRPDDVVVALRDGRIRGDEMAALFRR